MTKLFHAHTLWLSFDIFDYSRVYAVYQLFLDTVIT